MTYDLEEFEEAIRLYEQIGDRYSIVWIDELLTDKEKIEDDE